MSRRVTNKPLFSNATGFLFYVGVENGMPIFINMTCVLYNEVIYIQ